MKRIIIAMAAITALTMASCIKEPLVESRIDESTGIDIISAYSESAATKTSLNGNDSKGYDVLWLTGDKISIGGNTFTLIDGEGTTKGTFQGTLPEDGTYTACYPETYLEKGWPKNNIYVENRISGTPMTAQVTISDGKIDGPINFKNVGGILRLTLKGNATVHHILLMGNGQFSLDCSGGVTLNDTDGKAFYLPMPDRGKYTNMTFRIITNDGINIFRSLKSGKYFPIERNAMTDVLLSNINSPAPQGMLVGKFSVAEGSTVRFSKGNLRYTVDSKQWSFFDRQYDCGPLEYDDGHDKEISLFTWGYNSTQSIIPDGENGDNVSITSGDLSQNQDWGSQIGDGIAWRTLTMAEWQYLLNERTDAEQKCGFATVCGTPGLIILPDEFIDPMKNGGSKAFKPSTLSGWTVNVYESGGDWESMEFAGAVFFPASGRRKGNNVEYADHTVLGYYWSSSAYPSAYDDYSYYILFSGTMLQTANRLYRGYGCSVRLVTGEYTVKFDLNGKYGTAPESIRNIIHGSTITEPTEKPKAEGYAFTGWYKDKECKTLWHFDSDKVTANTTLYAGWKGGILPGKFRVSPNKQVYFSIGNLWADGSNALHFEGNQSYFTKSYDKNHVSRFTWSDSVGGAVGTKGSGTNLFCDENHKISVDGSAPEYYALSKDEWNYMLYNRGATSVRWFDFDISYCGVKGLVIYPDEYRGRLSPYVEYTKDNFPENYLFLPTAGSRINTNVDHYGRYGYYWASSSPAGKAAPDFLYFIFSNAGYDEMDFGDLGDPNDGLSLRLVVNVE